MRNPEQDERDAARARVEKEIPKLLLQVERHLADLAQRFDGAKSLSQLKFQRDLIRWHRIHEQLGMGVIPTGHIDTIDSNYTRLTDYIIKDAFIAGMTTVSESVPIGEPRFFAPGRKKAPATQPRTFSKGII